MHERGAIRNRQIAMQIRDFTGLRFGKITPTDIDGFLDFGDRLFIFIEGKRTGAPISYGQGLAMSRLVDACHCPPRRTAVALIVDHPAGEADIDYAIATVRTYRLGGKWRQPMAPITLRAAIDRFIAIAEKPRLRAVK